MNFNNVQTAVWTNEQQENVKVFFEDGNKFTLQKGSNDWNNLISAGWTEDKLIQSTAEYKRANAGAFFNHIDRLARQNVGYEYQVQKLRDELDDFYQDNDVYKEEYMRRFFEDIDAFYNQNEQYKEEYTARMYDQIQELDKEYHDFYYKREEEKRELERTILYNFSTEDILTKQAVEKAEAEVKKASKSIESVSLKNDESLLSNIVMFLNKYNDDPSMITKLKDMASHSGKDVDFSKMKSVMEILTALNE